MKFALVGIDDVTLPLAEYLWHHPQHTLSYVIVPPDQVARLPEFLIEARIDDSWESLLVAREVDAALLADEISQEVHEDKLRKLSQAELPLLVTHPSCSAIVAFEVDMIRRDVNGVVMPIFAGRSHPAIEQARDWIQSPDRSLIGAVERIDVERVVERPARDIVRRALALDAHYIGRLLGGVNHVSAVGLPNQQAENALNDLTVHFGSDQAIPARWSSVHRGEVAGRLRLLGAEGAAELLMAADPREWRWEITGAHARIDRYPDWNPFAAIVEELREAMQGRPHGATWQEACRDLEIAESAEVSLRRRRTIDVFSDTPTEESSFKGVMAAGSCGLLMLVLLAIVVLAVVEGLRWPTAVAGGPSTTEWPLLLRLWPVYPLAAFLVLQLLLFVARKPNRGPKAE